MFRFIIVFLVFIFSILLHFHSNAQGFEGTIEYAKEIMDDTIYYNYHVKGNLIRIDELDHEKNLVKYILVDKEHRTMKAINPKLKLFTQIQVKPYTKINDVNFQIIKSENSKEIKGYKCYQWRVRNVAQNTDITYWVASNGFRFFPELLQILNSAEKTSSFFLQVDDVEGFLPLSTVERTLLRVIKSKNKVVRIDEKILPESLFKVPDNYTAFDR